MIRDFSWTVLVEVEISFLLRLTRTENVSDNALVAFVPHAGHPAVQESTLLLSPDNKSSYVLLHKIRLSLHPT